MATMINGIRILEKKGRILTFKTYLIYIDWSTLPRTHGFGLMMLCDSCNSKNNYKESSLYKDLEENESLLKNYSDLYEALMENHEGAKGYVEKLVVSDFKNFPLKEEFTNHPKLWHELNSETNTFENEEHLPQATYTLEVTDERWIRHINPGEVWETTICDFQGPYWYLEHHSDKSHKFYRSYMDGMSMVTEFGKIGVRPRINKKRVRHYFFSAEDKVKEKLRKSKGYQLIYKNFDTPFHTEKSM